MQPVAVPRAVYEVPISEAERAAEEKMRRQPPMPPHGSIAWLGEIFRDATLRLWRPAIVQLSDWPGARGAQPYWHGLLRHRRLCQPDHLGSRSDSPVVRGFQGTFDIDIAYNGSKQLAKRSAAAAAAAAWADTRADLLSLRWASAQGHVFASFLLADTLRQWFGSAALYAARHYRTPLTHFVNLRVLRPYLTLHAHCPAQPRVS